MKKAMANIERAKEAAKQITIYQDFVERAKHINGDDIFSTEKDDLLKEMRAVHDEICWAAYRSGDQDTLNAHLIAFKEARLAICPPVKRKLGPRFAVVASNVYDDDSYPTTHYL